MPLTVFYSKNNVTREFLGETRREVQYDVMDIEFCCDEAQQTYDITYRHMDSGLALYLVLPENTLASFFEDQQELYPKVKHCYHCGKEVVFEKVRDANVSYRTELIERTIEERTEVPVIDVLWEDSRFKRKETE